MVKKEEIKMDSSTYYEFQRRIENAYYNRDTQELRNIKYELENYSDPDAKELILKLRM